MLSVGTVLAYSRGGFDLIPEVYSYPFPRRSEAERSKITAF